MTIHCYFCNKRFDYTCSCEIHLTIHTKERRLKCQLCKFQNKAFALNSGLLKHYRSVHPTFYTKTITERQKLAQSSTRKLNRCYFCSKDFKYASVRNIINWFMIKEIVSSATFVKPKLFAKLSLSDTL